MSTLSKLPVLIAGAGPTGLLLALTLTRNGVPVRIIEKDATFKVGQRGSGIQPRTLEIYNFLGMMPDYLKRGRTIEPFCIYEMPGGVKPLKIINMAPDEESTPSVPFRNHWVVGQDHNEEILRSHLAKHGISAELGTELVGFEQDANSVTAQIVKHIGSEDTNETAVVSYLVGAEGARSAVRKGLGCTFEGETRDMERILRADVEVEGLNRDYWHQWGDAHTVGVYLRPTTNGNTFTLSVFGRDVPIDALLLVDKEAIGEFVKKAINRHELKFGDMRGVSEWRPNIRMTNKYGEGRVYIAGDAAHVHPPTGGQGLNSGAQDAFNLAWKLSLVYKGYAAPTLLDTYQTERLPVIADLLGRTTAMWNDAVKVKAEESHVRRKPDPKVMNMLGVNCRWSSIVVDEQPEAEERSKAGAYLAEDPSALFAGDRAPEAPGLVPVGGSEETSLFNIFGPTYHTLLIFSAGGASIASAIGVVDGLPSGLVKTVVVMPKSTADAAPVKGVDMSVLDRDGHAYTFYPPTSKGSSLVVVRPDGVVGAIVKSSEGLKRYFAGIFDTV